MSIGSAFYRNGPAVAIAATTATQNIAIAGRGTPAVPFTQVRVVNASTGIAHIAFGTDNTVVASTASGANGNEPMLANTIEVHTVNPATTYVAVILESGSGNVWFTPGEGL